MRRHSLIGGTALLFVTAIVTAQPSMPPELLAMADTERAFAKTATVKGWRDAFLDFFADDAIAFANGVTPAKERLRQQPSTPFSVFELVWEPRLGDVAPGAPVGACRLATCEGVSSPGCARVQPAAISRAAARSWSARPGRMSEVWSHLAPLARRCRPTIVRGCRWSTPRPWFGPGRSLRSS